MAGKQMYSISGFSLNNYMSLSSEWTTYGYMPWSVALDVFEI
jgi:hypothetical protein